MNMYTSLYSLCDDITCHVKLSTKPTISIALQNCNQFCPLSTPPVKHANIMRYRERDEDVKMQKSGINY